MRPLRESTTCRCHKSRWQPLLSNKSICRVCRRIIANASLRSSFDNADSKGATPQAPTLPLHPSPDRQTLHGPSSGIYRSTRATRFPPGPLQTYS